VAIIDNDYIDSDLLSYFEEIVIADKLDAASALAGEAAGRTDEDSSDGIEVDTPGGSGSGDQWF
jgi:hypothetical protein